MQGLDKKFNLNIQKKNYVANLRVIVLTRNISSILLMFVFVEALDFSSFFRLSIYIIGTILLLLLIIKYIVYDRDYILLHAYNNGYKFKLKELKNIDYNLYTNINYNTLCEDKIDYETNEIKGLVKSFTVKSNEKNTVLLYNIFEFTDEQFYKFLDSKHFFENILNVYRKNFFKKIIIINIVKLNIDSKNIDYKTVESGLIVCKNKYKVLNSVSHVGNS